MKKYLSLITTLLAVFYIHPVSAESFKHIPLQYIVALGEPSANSGDNAETWGLWNQDPGPRGCLLENYQQLKKSGVASAQWKYDSSDWWLEEHGVIMEKPT